MTQSAFAIVSIIDELAHTLGMDPIILRKKKALREGSGTNTGQKLEGRAGLLECIERVEGELQRRSGVGNSFAAREVEGFPHLRGAWGFAAAFKNTGLGGGAPDKAAAEVELYQDSTAEARISSAEVGQGLVTVLQLIAAEELSLPPEKIRVLLSDTDLTPDGGQRQPPAGHIWLATQYAMLQAFCERDDFNTG